jgi:phage terminase large subunit-like protein
MDHFGENLIVQFPQGFLSFNAPFREMLELLALGRLHHDGNPVLRWMAGSTMSEKKGGLIKPSKDASPEKIDGIAALCMAMGRASMTGSVYESRGVLTI